MLFFLSSDDFSIFADAPQSRLFLHIPPVRFSLLPSHDVPIAEFPVVLPDLPAFPLKYHDAVPAVPPAFSVQSLLPGSAPCHLRSFSPSVALHPQPPDALPLIFPVSGPHLRVPDPEERCVPFLSAFSLL